MNVLVTGGTGLAGSHSIRELLDAGHTVRALVRSEAKLARVFPDAPKGLSSVVGDISDADSVRHVFPANTILAAGASLVVFDDASTQTATWPWCAGLASATLQTSSTGALSLNNTGDDIVLSDGVDSWTVTYTGTTVTSAMSETRVPDLTGGFAAHPAPNPQSPGVRADGNPF